MFTNTPKITFVVFVLTTVNFLITEYIKFIAESKNVTHQKGNSSLTSELEIRRRQWNEIVDLSVNETRGKRLPDVVGIGVKKCGTGATISFLRKHPLLRTKDDLESHFYDMFYSNNLDAYKNRMATATEREVIMEKTPAYFNFPNNDPPGNIKKDLPNVKLVLVLCDPVKRSYSDYMHETIQKWKSAGNARLYEKSMKYHIPDYLSTILTNGFYSIFLPRWTSLFDSKQLLILNGEDLINDPGSQIEKLQEFIGLPKLLLKKDFVRHPITEFFCIRPWWKATYDFEAERQKLSGWENELGCLDDTKGRTRHKENGFNFTSEYGRKLKELYHSSNEDIYHMTGINFNS